MSDRTQKILTLAKSVFRSPARFFLVFAMLFGVLFVFLTPPFQGPDESVHFLRAYQISDGDPKPQPLHDGYTASLPKSLLQTITLTFTNPGIHFDPNKKFEEGKIKQALHIPLNESDRRGYNVAATASYSPIPYLPQALAIFIGKLFNAPPVLLLYMARLANLAVAIGLVYLAIRLIPVGRWGLAVVALLPMTVFQSAVVTTDAVATGSLALFVAAILWAVTRKAPPNRRVWAALFGSGVLLALSKQAMFIFLPLLFLLPVLSKQFRARRNIILMIGVGAAALFSTGIWLLLTSDIGVTAQTTNDPVPTDQLRHILQAPWTYAIVLWNTYFFTWSDGIIRGVIGTFGWADTPMALPFVILGYMSVLVAAIHNTTGRVLKITPWAKVIIAAVVLLYLLAVSTALYMYYTPVGFEIVVGIQGRYFLPALLLATLLGVGSRTKFSKIQAAFFIKMVPLLLLTTAGLYILYRYYLHTV